ncbi:MAG: polysaccharide biosynthesis/export family protein [Microbacter sp.]
MQKGSALRNPHVLGSRLKNKTWPIFFIISLALLLGACNSEKQIVYVQNAGHYPNMNDTTQIVPKTKIKIGDLLLITVTTPTPDISIPFNPPVVPTPTTNDPRAYLNYNVTGITALQTYLVDAEGNITFPVVGTLHVEGLTEMELAQLIKDKIYPRYIKEEPIITIRYANYKISVLGEVNHPGVFPIVNEKVNVFEALAMAGDLTIYGQRNNVLLIREKSNGARETYRLDLNDKRLIHSPYFFLQQNDVLYVQPNGPKARSSHFSTAETLSISITGTLISLAALLVTILKH